MMAMRGMPLPCPLERWVGRQVADEIRVNFGHLVWPSIYSFSDSAFVLTGLEYFLTA